MLPPNSQASSSDLTLRCLQGGQIVPALLSLTPEYAMVSTNTSSGQTLTLLRGLCTAAMALGMTAQLCRKAS